MLLIIGTAGLSRKPIDALLIMQMLLTIFKPWRSKWLKVVFLRLRLKKLKEDNSVSAKDHVHS